MDGLQRRCRACSSELYALNNSSDRDWEWKIRREFGITPAQYLHLFIAQGGVCAICLRPETATYKGKLRRLAIDHDHETGRVRGLLCLQCNTALGKLEDDVTRLRRAIKYLSTTRFE